MTYLLRFSLLTAALTLGAAAQTPFAGFEARQVHPVCLTPDGSRLVAVDSASGMIAVFDVSSALVAPVRIAQIPVGLEPVSVRALSNDEVWVVNELSDSISIVSLADAVVTETLDAEDEPADVIFANGKAFITCARNNLIQVRDLATHVVLASIALDGLYPRALAASADGSKVFAAFLHSGNQTTVLPKDAAPAPPAPSNGSLPPAPPTALIVPAADPRINYTVLDHDIVEIDTASNTVTRYLGGTGTNLFDIAARPSTTELWIANTEALNLIRFEPQLRGHFVDSRLTKVDLVTESATAQDLNPGIDYNLLPNPTAQASALSQPMSVVFSAAGDVLWTAAFASDRVAKIDAATGNVLTRVDVRTGVDDSAAAMRGPRGLALDETHQRLFVLNKFSNTLTVVDAAASTVLHEVDISDHEPLPPEVKQGRGFLFDARLSGNGTNSCGICHIDADRDGLAWDLGDPGGEMLTVLGANLSIHDLTPRSRVMHPMKGPMVTQTLRGMFGAAPFHWRGDKARLQDFNGTFANLMGGSQIDPADMDKMVAYLETLRHHPNPNRNLDRSLPTSFGPGNPVSGRTMFNDHIKSHCITCHALPTGSDNNIDLMQEVGSTQPVKTPQLRTTYQRVFMDRRNGANTLSGFGLLHDGTAGGLSLPIVHPYVLDNLSTQQEFNDVTAFVLCFDTGTAPVVGYSTTVTSTNSGDTQVTTDIALLEARAIAADCDLVVRGRLGSVTRSYLFNATTQTYRTDRALEGSLTRSALLAGLGAGDAMTFVGVVPGDGQRFGGDVDLDTVLDGDDANNRSYDGAPRITTDLADHVAAPGAVVNLGIGVLGGSLSYQWFKNSQPIGGATGSTLQIAAAAAGDAGTYSVTITNTLGSASSRTAALQVYPAPIITTQPAARKVNQGQTATFSVTASGNGVTYQWRRGSNAIAGATTRTLTLRDTGAVDIASYSVVVSNGAGSVASNVVALDVVLRPVVLPLNLPDAIVGQNYTHTLLAQNNPTRFSVSGLPRGLAVNVLTGAISGRPTVSGPLFTAKVTASNSAGSSGAAVMDQMAVVPFPADAIGTFQGSIPRETTLNADLGGLLVATVGSTGLCSGYAKLGTKTYRFKGALDVTASVDPHQSFTIARRGMSSLEITLTLNPLTRSLSATISDAPASVTFPARLPTSTPLDYVGNYTLVMKLAPGDQSSDANPQGFSFAAFKVSTRGTASGTLKLADGSRVTLSAPVAQDGFIRVSQLLYSNTGSLLGSVRIDQSDAKRLNSSALSWMKKPQTRFTRRFMAGFGPLDLVVRGGPYAIPAKGTVAMGLTAGAPNAKMLFADGGAPDPATRLDVMEIEVKPGHPASLAITSANPGVVNPRLYPGVGTAFTAGSTGSFSGTFLLKDLDTSIASQPLRSRTASFYGMIVDDGSGPLGYGWFILPEMPSAGPPATTTRTSRELSGNVLLSPLP